MEILIIDIETNGTHTTYSCIVEIGMVLINTETNEIKPVFDELIREKHFDPKYHAWIYDNSDIKPEDVDKANSLEHYRDELQSYFDKYKLTAYNKSFDLRFLRDRNFIIDDTKCIMAATKNYFKVKNKKGGYKNPNVEETYAKLFPKENYIEKHRGCDDAMHEAKILLEMVKLKKSNKGIQHKLML